MHVHAAPDLLGRAADDIAIASACRDAGMAGIVVKAHLESTSSRAYHTSRTVPGFRYVGGVCLNYAVGGINPAAVDASLRMGGRVVWMPSGHSRYHAKLTGVLGDWGHPDMRIYSPPGARGLTVLDENGELTADTHEVVALVAEHNAVLATSHLSPEEIVILARSARQKNVKVIMTHIKWTPECDLSLGRTLVDLGGTVEIACSTVGGYTNRLPLDEARKMIQALGPENVIIASDAGGIRHPLPHEALRVLANNLLELDLRSEDLTRMLCRNPEAMLAE